MKVYSKKIRCPHTTPKNISKKPLGGRSVKPPPLQFERSGSETRHQKNNSGFFQPIVACAPEGTLTISRFIELMEKEEAKYPPEEQKNTSMMITRLRKIFYGSAGWDKYLIVGVDHIQSPYGTPKNRVRNKREVELPGPFNNFEMQDKEHYPVDESGNRPEIYLNQEVMLEGGNHDGYFADMGHVFAGLDAFNHRAQVNALGDIEIDNVEGATWVGDLGSILAELQIDFVNNDTPPTKAAIQKRVDEYAPAQDMLGNIDAYAIASGYDIDTSQGKKVSEILRMYYLSEQGDCTQDQRYTVFCKGIGLQGWDGSSWTNIETRIKHYTDQVNDSAAMYIGVGNASSFTGWLSGRVFAVGTAMNEGAEYFVRAFFDTLKSLRAKEQI